MNESKPVASNEDWLFPVEETEPKKPVRTSQEKLITTLTLSNTTCRWPFGDPATPDFYYCGELPQAGGVYCDTHDAMSRPAGQRRR